MISFHYPVYLPPIILLISVALAMLVRAPLWAPKSAGASVPRRFSEAVRHIAPERLLIAAVLAYAVTFVALALLRHRAFATGSDLAIFDQATWLLSRGKAPFVSVRGLHAFGDHTSLILLLIAPLYRVFDTPVTLLVLQSLVVPLGAIPLYWLGRERLAGRQWPLLAPALYLLHPATAYVTSFDFHPDALAMPLVLFAFYYGLRGQGGRLLLFGGMAALCKEDVALTLFAMGLYLAWRGQRRLGWTTSALAIAWLALCILVILPYFNGVGPFYAALYAPGSRSADTLRGLLGRLVQGNSREFITLLLLPAGGISLLGWRELLIAAPATTVCLLSSRGSTHSILYQYTAMLVPWVCVSAIEGLYRLGRLEIGELSKAGGRPGRLAFAGIYVLCAATLSHFFFSPSPLSLQFVFDVDKAVDRAPRHSNFLSDQHDGSARHALGMIPPGAAVAAQYLLTPHLAHRQQLYQLPLPFYNAMQTRGLPLWGVPGQTVPEMTVDYVLVDSGDDTWPMSEEQVKQLLARLTNDPAFQVVFAENGVTLFRRTVTS